MSWKAMKTKSNKTNDQGSSVCNQIALHISANPEYLRVVRLAVRQVGHVVGFDEKTCELITLAVEESLTNIIKHSYGGPCDEQLIVKFNKIENVCDGKSALEIVIRDFGKQVDPEIIKGRDLDNIRPGGLGVHLIQSVMDEVKYDCADECGMVLRMIKYLS
jgi:anti-sigma regulatory factor (Ser/Thr protein kinase)